MRDPAVRATEIVLGYGTTIALDRSSFSLPAGIVTAVIGPNGSGKSTLLNAIAGLIEPKEGSLQVEAPRKRISYVMQATKVNEMLPVTVDEVVSMGRFAEAGPYRRLTGADRIAVTEAIDRMGVSNLRARHVSRLSSGQRQRAFVAQGLAQDHDLLLLDEPLTGIDLPTAQAIDEIIHDEVSRGCTVVMTTHDLSEAHAAEHVLLLAGRLVASGPPSTVLTPENLNEAYGQALLHFADGRLLIDDAAHDPVAGRHLHRERTIHVESSHDDAHGE
jgi:manganese transport system ATP-binding protein